MAIRSFFAIDSASLVVTSSSNTSIVGNSVINNSDTPNGTIFSYSGGGGTTVELDDTSRRSRFDDDREQDHVITDGGGIVANGTEVEAESLIELRALDGSGNPTGPTITITVFSQNGTTSDVWGFGSDTKLEPGTSYIKTGGNNIGTTRYSDFVACFGPGTPIATPCGEIPVEQLSRGQAVWSRDGGDHRVRWIATTEVPGTGSFAPVVFEPGAIGNTRELVVSQQHRIFFENAHSELLFGTPEILVPAKHLCGLPGVSIQERDRIRYTHFMCDQHIVVQSAGALSESFFLADHAVNALDQGPRQELLDLFPSLAKEMASFGPTVAPTLKAHEAAVFRSCLRQSDYLPL
ncbi:Hint domain-containing protein [Aliiroseovarius sp. S1339]|uniref:Hint domain-containing protein n=1 Tax=Aliiroseovarius sp. S1339 TaxID=2936990 RepID=UPI0020C16F31|nr:Hint domain-containing protein [Aliiroseovarius sp. S1339]MCK8462466.1 Hint domain-containing protein [Aliiroseovarius sp. S1339]